MHDTRVVSGATIGNNDFNSINPRSYADGESLASETPPALAWKWKPCVPWWQFPPRRREVLEEDLWKMGWALEPQVGLRQAKQSLDMAKAETLVTALEQQLETAPDWHVVPVTGFPSHQQLSFLWFFYIQWIESLVPSQYFLTVASDARTVTKMDCKMPNNWCSQQVPYSMSQLRLVPISFFLTACFGADTVKE
jgi:hypothetical protein